MASATAPSGAQRRGLNILEDATGGVSALRESTPHSSSPVTTEEAAALFPLEERGWRKLTAKACPNGVGHVDCVNGFVDGTNESQSCQDACGGLNNTECCGGSTDACQGFTGRVCRDGSCLGSGACFAANVALVSKSCTNTFSCYGVVRENPDLPIANMIDSCIGSRSCYAIAQQDGSVKGDISDSCVGDYACAYLAHIGDVNGDISDSCNGDNACQYIAANSTETSISQGLDFCCNTEGICLYASETSLPDNCFPSSPTTVS